MSRRHKMPRHQGRTAPVPAAMAAGDVSIGTVAGGGYDAINGSKRRRQAPRSSIQAEELVLQPSQRRQLNATALDQVRNFALAGWMVRKHTAYCSRFDFHAVSDDVGFKNSLQEFITVRARARNFDVARRCDLHTAITTMERDAILNGDSFWLKLRNGAVQLIESDLVAKPQDLPSEYAGTDYNWVHGIDVDTYTQPRNYCLCTRFGSSRQFGRVARAVNVLARLYPGRPNQVRGVSPLAPSINTQQDLYESFEYNLVKAKLHALFGVAILRKTPQTGSMLPLPVQTSITTPASATTESGSDTIEQREVKSNFLKLDNPAVLDLDADAVEILESKTPSGEFKDYSEMMIQVALLALDLPYVLYDAKAGSFSIHRTARAEYEKACKPHQEALMGILDYWTLWQLALAIDSGEFKLPGRMTLDQVKWEWVPEGTPWFNELDEMDAGIAGVAAGMIDPYRWHKAHGTDADEVLQAIARWQARAKELGLQLVLSKPPITLAAAPNGKDALQ